MKMTPERVGGDEDDPDCLDLSRYRKGLRHFHMLFSKC